jgi:hypothetical protein
MRENESRKDTIAFAAEVGQRLNSIHPFQDANGRTTRLITDWVLQRGGLPPAIYKDIKETEIVIFPRDLAGKNPAPGVPVETLTDAVERSLSLLKQSSTP